MRALHLEVVWQRPPEAGGGEGPEEALPGGSEEAGVGAGGGGDPGPIRGEHCGHVTRSPPITAHLAPPRRRRWCSSSPRSQYVVIVPFPFT